MLDRPMNKNWSWRVFFAVTFTVILILVVIALISAGDPGSRYQ